MDCRTRKTALPGIAALLAMAVTAACAPTALQRSHDADSDTDIIWPESPQRPRIRYIFTLSEPQDIGIRPGFLSRFVQFFAGREVQGMVRPYAVVADESLIAVADPGLQAVHLYFTNASRYEVIRDVDGDPLRSPVGITFADDSIFVSDSVTGKVHVLDRDGEHRHTISNLSRPTGITFHPESQRLFVTDTAENRVVVFDKQGSRLFSFGNRGRGPGEFNYPTTLTAVGQKIFVNDTMNFRVQEFTLDGLPISGFGEIGDGSGQFALSKGIGADSQGHLYVSDGLSNHVQIFDPAGRFLLAFGGMGVQAGQFRLPAGVFVFADTIYVADSQNRRVQVFEYIDGET